MYLVELVKYTKIFTKSYCPFYNVREIKHVGKWAFQAIYNGI